MRRLTPAIGVLLGLCTGAVTATDRDTGLTVRPHAATQMEPVPVPGPHAWITTSDNENNAHSGAADGDMGMRDASGSIDDPNNYVLYLFNGDSVAPIEFNIVTDEDPGCRAASLRMNAFDVDSNVISDPEIDEVLINDHKVGVLNGADGTTQLNEFLVPPGIVKKGANRVQINVDIGNPGFGHWATAVGFGLLSLVGKPGQILINRAYVEPADGQPGDQVKFTAEVSCNASYVEVFQGTSKIAKLTDPGHTGLYTGNYTIPSGKPLGAFTMKAIKIENGVPVVKHRWPLLTIKPRRNGGGGA